MARHDPEQYRGDDPAWQRVMGAKGWDRLVAYAEQLNNLSWIAASGKLYYIASLTKADGKTEHYVDRHI